MNFSNYTKQEDYKVHYYYAYVHQWVTWLAVIINLVCAVVFAQRKLLASGPFFQYSLLNSLGASTGMLILSAYAFIRCGPLCSQAYSYPAMFFELYGILYICNSLYFGGSLIQIAISFQLYFSITQKFKWLNSIAPMKIMAVFTLCSFSMGLCILFSFKITVNKYLTISNDGTEKWQYIYQVILDSNNRVLYYFAIFFVVVSNKIFLVILIIINILLYVELKKIMQKKHRLMNNSSSTRTTSRTTGLAINTDRSIIESGLDLSNNDQEFRQITAIETAMSTTLAGLPLPNGRKRPRGRKDQKGNEQDESKRKTLIMVLWVSVVFSSSRFVFAISNLILLLMQNSVYNWWSSAFNYFYGACVYISYFFVYMKTNKLFRKNFYKIFLRKEIK